MNHNRSLGKGGGNHRSPLSNSPRDRYKRHYVAGKIGSSRSPSPGSDRDEDSSIARRRQLAQDQQQEPTPGRGAPGSSFVHHSHDDNNMMSQQPMESVAPPLVPGAQASSQSISPEPRLVQYDVLQPYHRRRMVDENSQRQHMRRSQELNLELKRQMDEDARLRREAFLREQHEDSVRLSGSNVFSSQGSFTHNNRSFDGPPHATTPNPHLYREDAPATLPVTTSSNNFNNNHNGLSAQRQARLAEQHRSNFTSPGVANSSGTDGHVRSRRASVVPVVSSLPGNTASAGDVFELLSPGNVFDHERRAQQDLLRQKQKWKMQEELQAILDQQIADKKAEKAAIAERERRLDEMMEERGRREAEAQRRSEEMRSEKIHQLQEESKRENTKLQEQKKGESSLPYQGTYAARKRRQSSKSPTLLDENATSTSNKAGGEESIERQLQRQREEYDQMMSLLKSIQEELAKPRPLPEPRPSEFLYSKDGPSPLPATPPDQSIIQKTPLQSSGFHAHHTSPVRQFQTLHSSSQSPTQTGGNFHAKSPYHSDEAQQILEKNRRRLGALRSASHHDDILKAFLLRDSTAAARTVEMFGSV